MQLRPFAATFTLLALAAFAHEGIDEQIAELNRRIAAAPKDAALYLHRAELHRVHRAPELALADVERAAELDADCAGLELVRGKTLFDGGELERAETALTKHISRHPQDADALLARAKTRAAARKLAEADDDFAAALATLRDPRPEHFADHARVVAARGTEHVARAIAILDTGQTRLGFNAALQLPAIELELAREHFDGALARIDELARRSERVETWLAKRGDVLARAGRDREAREARTAALAAIDKLPAKVAHTRATAQLRRELERALGEVTR